PTGCTLVFTQSGEESEGELGTGSYFELECYKNGQWAAVKLFPEDDPIQWTDEGWIISCGDLSEFTENWEWLYGELPAGKYRLGKEIMDLRKTTDFDKKMYYAYFEIEAD
ncbi:MAG: hypothetical protein K2J72_02150, partial [Oscillospiraceae bacterium]|nr:hypothetical protein [Oscillospiraceae bacterium]